MLEGQETASTGVAELDGALGGLFWGDNVVWEPEDGTSAEPFYRAASGQCGDFRPARGDGPAVGP
jgi:hypothetical protein